MKNTVMSPEQRLKIINDNMPPEAKYGDVFQAIAEAQARTTCPICFKAGIKEAVDWIESAPTRKIDGAEQYICTLEQWQSQLRKWGIEKVK